MDRVKGRIVDILSESCLLLEIDFNGNYNHSNYPDSVKVHFEEITPPYLKNVAENEKINVLRRRALGEIASIQVRRRISEDEISGRVQLEGAKFRKKSKTNA